MSSISSTVALSCTHANFRWNLVRIRNCRLTLRVRSSKLSENLTRVVGDDEWEVSTYTRHSTFLGSCIFGTEQRILKAKSVISCMYEERIATATILLLLAYIQLVRIFVVSTDKNCCCGCCCSDVPRDLWKNGKAEQTISNRWRVRTT